MLLTTVLALFCSAVIIYLALEKFETIKLAHHFPGPRSFPIIGNAWYFLKPEERLRNMIRLQKEFGNRVLLSGGSLKGMSLFHPDDVQKILTSKEINKSSFYDLLFSGWLGTSLFYAKDQEYFRLRKMLLPAFDTKRVDNIEINFNEHSKILVKILKIQEANGIDPEIRSLFSLCAMDMVMQYLVGKSTNCLSNSNQDYATAVHNQTKFVSERGCSPWLWPKIAWKLSKNGAKEKTNIEFLHSFMDKIVQERKEEISGSKNATPMNLDRLNGDESPEKEKQKALDLLIREQERGQFGITDKYIRDEINAFTFAGHDTIASALTFTVFLLAANPDEQEKLHLELDEVFGNDRDRNVDTSDLSRLKYLECCFKESLRLYPSAPFLMRKIDKDFQLDEEITLPTGLQVVICPYATQRLPQFFPEPNKFQPSRFIPENAAGRHPYAYIPFSAGPRNCMGQKTAIVKAKTILAHVFRSFQVELVNPPEKMIPMGSMIMFPKDGLNIKLKSR